MFYHFLFCFFCLLPLLQQPSHHVTLPPSPLRAYQAPLPITTVRTKGHDNTNMPRLAVSLQPHMPHCCAPYSCMPHIAVLLLLAYPLLVHFLFSFFC